MQKKKNGREEIRTASVCRWLGLREEDVRRLLWGVRENAGGGRRNLGPLPGVTWRVPTGRWDWDLWWICHFWQQPRCSWQWCLDLHALESPQQIEFHEEESSRHLLWPPGIFLFSFFFLFKFLFYITEICIPIFENVRGKSVSTTIKELSHLPFYPKKNCPIYQRHFCFLLINGILIR